MNWKSGSISKYKHFANKSWKPFWDNEYRNLSYTHELFNNNDDLIKWRQQGYNHVHEYFTGLMCDMRKPQPSWNEKFIEWFSEEFGLKDVCTSYYAMGTGVILPNHRDTYMRYIELFNCSLNDVERAIVFLEDWQSGHYFEIENTPIIEWNNGDYVWWKSNTEHMAANIGVTKRYTLQLTGHH